MSDPNERSDDGSTGAADVPVVDISPFFDGSPGGRADVAAALTGACERIGFVMVAGHGVPDDLVDEFYATAKAFFQLPLEEKLKVKSPIDNLFQGYACPGDGPGFHTSERQSFNVSRWDTIDEAVALGAPPDIGETCFDALWPEHPAEFRSVWRRYFAAMDDLARRLLRVFEAGLGLEAGFFDQAIGLDPSTQVANYYSYDIDAGHDPSPYRFKAHLDGDIFTILHQDDGPGGLQLHQRGLGWRDVAPVPGTFVVNIGELMARYTNDHLAATPHRVLKPADDETEPRMSAPYFLKPTLDAVIAPIPELLADGEAPRYEPITGRQWLIRGQEDIYAGYDSTKQFEERAEQDPALR